MVHVGDEAPEFKLPNQKGITVSLQSLIGSVSPLMVIFYKYNCPTCQFTFPYLAQIAKKLGPEHFLAVGQDSVVEVNAFKTKYSFNFDVLSDVHPYPVSVLYGLEFVPTFFIIEADKKISKIAEGFDKKVIEDFSNRIAKNKSQSGFQAFDPSAQVPLLKPG